MTSATLTIDLGAIVRNWQALDTLTECETAAVVKASGYGLSAPHVALALARAGARQRRAPRRQRPVQTARAAPAPRPTDAAGPGQERIEIPAFVRGQAK